MNNLIYGMILLIVSRPIIWLIIIRDIVNVNRSFIKMLNKNLVILVTKAVLLALVLTNISVFPANPLTSLILISQMDVSLKREFIHWEMVLVMYVEIKY